MERHWFASVPYHSQPVHGGVSSQGHSHSPEPPIGVAEICWRHLREDPWVLCERVHGTPQQHWWEHKVHHRTGNGRQAAVPWHMYHLQWWWLFGSHSVPKTHTQTNIWTLTLTTISNTRGLLCEHSLTEQTAWSLNQSRKMLRSYLSSPHSKPMATRSGPSRSAHPKTSPTPLVTPLGARPTPAWAYLISEVHSKNWPEFSKTRGGRGGVLISLVTVDGWVADLASPHIVLTGYHFDIVHFDRMFMVSHSCSWRLLF